MVLVVLFASGFGGGAFKAMQYSIKTRSCSNRDGDLDCGVVPGRTFFAGKMKRELGMSGMETF